MTISVVIATYNRARQLDACLRQLGQQAFGAGDEVVVADNGSTDDTQEVLRQAAQRMPGILRVVVESRPGKSHAVASAVRDCRCDILAFTDDDVLVGKDWLTSIRAAMEDPALALVGGPVLPLYERRVPDWLNIDGASGFGRLAAPLALLHYGAERTPLGSRVLLGANMAIRRDAFLRAGGFPADLGKLRGTLLSGEDHELCERVQAAGYGAAYDPAIRVRHRVPAGRVRIGYFLRWFYWSGVTHAALDAGRGGGATGRRILGLPGFVVRQLATALLATGGSVLRSSWSAALDHATRVAFAAGYASAVWKRDRVARPTPVAPGRRAEAA